MASRGNQHCANCIGTLSFPVLKPRSVIRLQFDKRFRAKVSIRNTSFQPGMSDRLSQTKMHTALCNTQPTMRIARRCTALLLPRALL